MDESKRYKVIVSVRAKRMLGTHVRFLAQVNKEAATTKKKEVLAAIRSLSKMPHRYPFLRRNIFLQTNIISYLSKNGILFCIKSEIILFMWTTFLIVGKSIIG